jgi:multiple sugar transport system permease protein
MQLFAIYTMFIWKNVGINVLILLSSIINIDKNIKEAAKLDGAHSLKMHFFITIPIIMPYIFFVAIFSFINSIKIFKESYLFFGTNYPPDVVYTIQYYMNNNFYKLKYQNLTTSVNILIAIFAAFILLSFNIKNKYDKRI